MPADSEPPRLFFDEDADGRLAAALRRDGYDVEDSAATGRLGATDEDQLAYAASRRRTLVTHNIRHFPALHAAWRASGREHHGIVVLIGQASVGVMLRRMHSLVTLTSASSRRNRLFFLGAQFDAGPAPER